MEKPKIFTTSFASVYFFYILKVENKVLTKSDGDQIICWLTGYNRQEPQLQIDLENNFQLFSKKTLK